MKSVQYSCRILTEFEFSQQILEKYTNVKFMKICPVRAELLHADGRTDRQTSMTQLKVVFPNFS